MTTILLMRHGETEWKQERRVKGWAPVGLSERGREQAATAAAYLDENDSITPDRVISSDLKRTQETTEVIRSVIDSSVEFDSAWRERDMGIYQGLLVRTVRERYPKFGAGKPQANAIEQIPESGESIIQVSDRVVGGWHDLLTTSDHSDTVLVVTHGGPIRLLLGHLQDMSIADAMLTNRLDNCSVTEIEHAQLGESSIVRKNVTSWSKS